MVLAKSLRNVKTRHDLVLLHTDDVPLAALELLSRAGWKIKEVEPIAGVSELYNHGEPRFEGVFTKLRAMGLEEYEKIAMLDIDTLALRSLDDLFDLPAPAAMARGPGSGYRHGDAIDGRYFFRGYASGGSWGQAWGINAGVMLWKPSKAELDQMLLEVLDPKHPSHVRGNGPEQDYLSRFWANRWTHIGVEYNYQLHQMYYALNPDYVTDHCYWDRNRFLFEEPAGNGIRLVHYSGHLKPWTRWIDNVSWVQGQEGDAPFAKEVLESFPGYWIWVRRSESTWEKKQPLHGLVLDPEGKIRRVDWSKQGEGSASSATRQPGSTEWADADLGDDSDDADGAGAAAPGSGGAAGDEVAAADVHPSSYWPLGEEVPVPPAAIKGAQTIVDRSLLLWNDVYRELQAELGCADLSQALRDAYAPVVDTSDGYVDDDTQQSLEPSKPGWTSCGGWWVDSPVIERGSVIAGCAPERFMSFTFEGRTLLEVRGGGTSGARGVAVAPDGGVHVLPDTAEFAASGAIASWANELPEGALVLIALVDPAPQALAEVSRALLDASVASSGRSGAPLVAALPRGCRVAAVAALKGKPEDAQTMAAPDFALATQPFRAAVPSAASA